MNQVRSRMDVAGRRWGRGALALLGLLALSACQVLPEREIPEPEPPVLQPPPVPAAPVRLVDAMDALQNGQFERALGQLDELLRANPGSPTLGLLRRQLIEAPSEVLPGPYRSLRVEPGDTLSELAERELGNPLLFVALARLNGLQRPRSLAVGAELRVPVRAEPQAPAPTLEVAEEDAAVPAAAAPNGATTGTTLVAPRRSELVTVAEYLLASGQPTDARELLTAAARDGGLAPDAEKLLVELSLDSARVEASAGQFSEAVAALAETVSVLPPGPERARLEVRRSRIEVLQRLDQADDFESRGVLGEAHRVVQEALAIDPDYTPAVQREQRIRETLVADYHERALRAWRARDIDLAIRTWRSLLDHAPEFEPARVYLDRAEELRQRLDGGGSG